MAEKLKKHASKLILGIRGEDIKFDLQNIDVYKDNKIHIILEIVNLDKHFLLYLIELLTRLLGKINLREEEV